MIGVGVIGVGAMGALHAENFCRCVTGARLVAVAEPDDGRRRDAAARCGCRRRYASAQALIDDPLVDAVVIASPDGTHAGLTLACLANGKPALCEKPLATTYEDAKRVLDAELSLNRRLVRVGFMRTCDADHVQLKDALDELGGGALYFRSRAVNPSKPVERSAFDVVNNSAIHDIHSARWLMDSEIVSVFVEHVPYHASRPDTCRLMTIAVRFASGALGQILINSEAGYGYEVEVEIATGSAQLKTPDTRSPELRCGAGAVRAITPGWRQRFAAAYRDAAQQWIDTLGDGDARFPDVWDGFSAMLVARACQQSVRSGRPEPVERVPQPGLYGRR